MAWQNFSEPAGKTTEGNRLLVPKAPPSSPSNYLTSLIARFGAEVYRDNKDMGLSRKAVMLDTEQYHMKKEAKEKGIVLLMDCVDMMAGAAKKRFGVTNTGWQGSRGARVTRAAITRGIILLVVPTTIYIMVGARLSGEGYLEHHLVSFPGAAPDAVRSA